MKPDTISYTPGIWICPVSPWSHQYGQEPLSDVLAYLFKGIKSAVRQSRY